MLSQTVSHPLATIPASFPIGERWYAYYTHIHVEKITQKSILELGYQTFIPFEKRIVRRPGAKPRQYEVPLFPRYGFVKFDINDHNWGQIKYCKGVVDVLRNDGIPISISRHDMDRFILAESMGLFDRTKPPATGMQVLVTHGPFSDMLGKVIKARAKDRVAILLNFFGSMREVEIPLVNLREV